MPQLTREWVSVEQARQWFDTYAPDWLSDKIVHYAATKRRWARAIIVDHALIVDEQTNICHEGLAILLKIIKAEEGRMCWVARARDFHFSQGQLEDTPMGKQLVTRTTDTVRIDPLPLPYARIEDEDLPPHLRHRP
jgi:hypothetical protein